MEVFSAPVAHDLDTKAVELSAKRMMQGRCGFSVLAVSMTNSACTFSTTECLQWWVFTPVTRHPCRTSDPKWGGDYPRVGLYPELYGIIHWNLYVNHRFSSGTWHFLSIIPFYISIGSTCARYFSTVFQHLVRLNEAGNVLGFAAPSKEYSSRIQVITLTLAPLWCLKLAASNWAQVDKCLQTAWCIWPSGAQFTIQTCKRQETGQNWYVENRSHSHLI